MTGGTSTVGVRTKHSRSYPHPSTSDAADEAQPLLPMTRSRAVVRIFSVALALTPATVSAQTVLVRVQTEETSMPVFGALTYLVGASGATVKSGLTDERGRALFVGIPAGSYRVRVEMIGMATAESELFDVAEGTSVSQDIRLESSAIQLEGISVEAEGGSRCSIRPTGEGLAIADVWDEARKALSAAAFTDAQGAYRYETVTYRRQLDRDRTILDEERNRREGYMLTPFESLPAEDLVTNGFVQADGIDHMYFAPDASVLLSDVFLDTHCFRLARGSDDAEGLIGLAFEPTGENRRVVDIRGTMWIDAETAELRWLEYTYEYLDPDITSSDIGGRVDFQRMPAGTWIVPEWWIRMPRVGEQYDGQGRRQRFVTGFVQTGGIVLDAKEAGGRSLGQRVQTGGIEGVVVDSVGVPRRGVRVGVAGSNQEVYTNAEGSYSITGLQPGRYQVRFVDPDLEAAGFVPPPVPQEVIRGEAATLDYHMPSIGDVLFEACRDEVRLMDSAVLAGIVRDFRGRPVQGVSVRVEWTDFGAVRPFVSVSTEAQVVTTDQQGFYRFCSVPTDKTLSLVVIQNDETESEPIEVAVGVGDEAVLQPLDVGRGN